MAAGIAPISVSVSAGNHLKPCNRSSPFLQVPILRMQRNFRRRGTTSNFPIRAEYNDRRGGTGGDFVAGFLLGGAIFGTLSYVFAPQASRVLSLQYVFITPNDLLGSVSLIRRSLLNEDEYGFRRARRPIYYDEGLEKTRQTLNEKISQLNSAIDNVSSRLRGGNNMPPVPVETDPEEATM